MISCTCVEIESLLEEEGTLSVSGETLSFTNACPMVAAKLSQKTLPHKRKKQNSGYI
jgi:hypothetical protein